MTVSNLKVDQRNVISFTKPFLKEDKKWFPFRESQGKLKQDHVLYVTGERAQDLTSGEVSYRWSLRMIGPLGQTYTFDPSGRKLEDFPMDLEPLEEIYRELGWSLEELKPKDEVQVN